MTEKTPIQFKYEGANPAGLGQRYARAALCGRRDVMVEIDLFVFEEGNYNDSAVDEFLAFADSVDDSDFDSEYGPMFEDERISRSLIEVNIRPVHYPQGSGWRTAIELARQ